MIKKFNPKHYAGKSRIYVSVPNAPRISRLWVWDENDEEYRAPNQGKSYMLGRYETDSQGLRKRKYQFSSGLEEARQWQNGDEQNALTLLPVTETPAKIGPLFSDLIAEWKRRCFPRIAASTRISYENLIRLHFGSLLGLTIHEITPQRMDLWLDELKAPESWTMKSRKRKTFRNELKLLATILNYYGTYHDDPEFRFPIKQRHRLGIRLNRHTAKPKDLKEETFFLFREKLRTLNKRGELMAGLATVQYYQALRISEAAALCWEDIDVALSGPRVDDAQPIGNRIQFPRQRMRRDAAFVFDLVRRLPTYHHLEWCKFDAQIVRGEVML